MVTHEATPLVPGVGPPTDPNYSTLRIYHTTPRHTHTPPHHTPPPTPELLLESEDMDAVVIGNKIVANREAKRGVAL